MDKELEQRLKELIHTLSVPINSVEEFDFTHSFKDNKLIYQTLEPQDKKVVLVHYLSTNGNLGIITYQGEMIKTGLKGKCAGVNSQDITGNHPEVVRDAMGTQLITLSGKGYEVDGFFHTGIIPENVQSNTLGRYFLQLAGIWWDYKLNNHNKGNLRTYTRKSPKEDSMKTIGKRIDPKLKMPYKDWLNAVMTEIDKRNQPKSQSALIIGEEALEAAKKLGDLRA